MRKGSGLRGQFLPWCLVDSEVHRPLGGGPGMCPGRPRPLQPQASCLVWLLSLPDGPLGPPLEVQLCTTLVGNPGPGLLPLAWSACALAVLSPGPGPVLGRAAVVHGGSGGLHRIACVPVHWEEGPGPGRPDT